MKIFAVIHMTLQNKNSITLVQATNEQEAKEVYLKAIGLTGSGTQLKVQELEEVPSVICTISEGEEIK